MAASRLIAVMLVLLFLSSLVAALAPVEQESGDDTTTTDEPPPAETTEERGAPELLHEKLDARAKRPRTIEARVGDQLQLVVRGGRVATVELVGIGATEDVAPEAPARFDVLLDREGEFPIRLLESGREIGLLAVTAPRAPREPARDPARDLT